MINSIFRSLTFSQKKYLGAMLIVLSVVVFIFYSIFTKKNEQALNSKFELLFAVDELRQSEVNLNLMALGYINTQNIKFKKYHQIITDLRNDKLQKPLDIIKVEENIDFTELSIRDLTALSKSKFMLKIEQIGFSEPELQKIKNIFKQADLLAKMENEAFDSLDKKELDLTTQIKKANAILFSGEYLQNRKIFNKQIQEVYKITDDRTDRIIETIRLQIHSLYVVFFVLLLLLVYLIKSMCSMLFKTLGGDIDVIYSQLKNFIDTESTLEKHNNVVHAESIFSLFSLSQAKLKSLQIDLKTRETILRELVENMKSGVVIYEPISNGKNFRIRAFNKAGEKIENINRKEVVGKLVTEVFPGVEDFGIFKVFQRVFQTGIAEIFPATFYKDNRISGWRENYIYKIPSGEIVVIYDDITENKKNAEILEAAKIEAENANRAKSKFIANMSHEIRTPLNAIIGIADLLAETNLDDEQKKYVIIFDKATGNLLKLVNDILDISRIDGGSISIVSSSFNLKKIIAEVVDLFEYQASEKNIILKTEIDLKLPKEFIGDSIQIQHILRNLMSNAIKFTPSGSITLKVEANKDLTKKGNLYFSVIDTGIGISESDSLKIFQPFVQLDDSLTKKASGTGLGLIISKKLVELMGGEIWFTSKENAGTNFNFTIQCNFILNSEKQIVKSSHLTSQLYPHLKKENYKILLVDDMKENRLIIKAFLKNHTNFIIEAENGEIALEKFKYEKFDLVFMDIQMPIMDGYSATQEMRRWEQINHLERTPIVAITAFALNEERQKSLASGCDIHLTKPITKTELLGAFSEYCG